MLINGCKTFIVRCRFCGRLREYDSNIFQIMTNNKVEYKCKCGEVNILLQKKNNKEINAQISCFDCGDKHFYNLKLQDMLKDNDMLYCLHGPELCFFGSKKYGNQLLLEKQINIKENSKEEAGEDYFNNFKVLIKALSKLYTLNKEAKLSCDCGNSKINMEFFPDRIELKCFNCHSVNIVFTETEEDLSVLLKKDKIILRKHNISCIDSINEMKRDIKK